MGARTVPQLRVSHGYLEGAEIFLAFKSDERERQGEGREEKCRNGQGAAIRHSDTWSGSDQRARHNGSCCGSRLSCCCVAAACKCRLAEMNNRPAPLACPHATGQVSTPGGLTPSEGEPGCSARPDAGGVAGAEVRPRPPPVSEVTREERAGRWAPGASPASSAGNLCVLTGDVGTMTSPPVRLSWGRVGSSPRAHTETNVSDPT